MTIKPPFEMIEVNISQALPALITPQSTPCTLDAAFPEIQRAIDLLLLTHGGVLLRDFNIPEISAFQQFASNWGYPLLNYDFASTPRQAINQGVYTSTEYPAHQTIPLHNEQAYTLEWPMKIWFHCVIASPIGGETPIADSRRIYKKIPNAIRHAFETKQLCYVRNYGNGLDLSWQQVFNTDKKHLVENFCRQRHIAFEWKEDGELRTKQRVQSVAQHPTTLDWVWFNQAHLFHASALQADTRHLLIDTFGEENLPRHVYFGDGSPISDTLLDDVRAVLDAETISFPWKAGDILMLDNMLTAHARAPFEGPRKIVVAMAQPFVNQAFIQQYFSAPTHQSPNR